jgi:hypothetical protein
MQDIRDRLGSMGQSVREPEMESIPSSKINAQADISQQRREME